jgi:hypothetical protein
MPVGSRERRIIGPSPRGADVEIAVTSGERIAGHPAAAEAVTVAAVETCDPDVGPLIGDVVRG